MKTDRKNCGGSQDWTFDQVNLQIAAYDFLGQGPIRLKGPSVATSPQIDFLKITKSFGRFGNNYYQAMHAAVIAHAFRIKKIVMPAFDGVEPASYDQELGFSISLHPEGDEGSSYSLFGAFYAPYGFENLFTGCSNAWLSKVLRRATDLLYSNFGAKVTASKTLAVHIRAGDIFSGGTVPNWYVQPPASFYIKAIEHAVSKQAFDHCELVFEDRGNPALEVVETYLQERGLSFCSRSLSVHDDIARLVSADGIIFSFSSFVEAAALISKSVKMIYSFRSVSSQIDFAPFLQTRIAGIFLERGVDVYVVEDMSVHYIAPKTWTNSDDQRALITGYPERNLRIFALTRNYLGS